MHIYLQSYCVEFIFCVSSYNNSETVIWCGKWFPFWRGLELGLMGKILFLRLFQGLMGIKTKQIVSTCTQTCNLYHKKTIKIFYHTILCDNYIVLWMHWWKWRCHMLNHLKRRLLSRYDRFGPSPPITTQNFGNTWPFCNKRTYTVHLKSYNNGGKQELYHEQYIAHNKRSPYMIIVHVSND